ncbi:MAG: phosphatidylinositol kinase [Alphaproteobacteria bacterium RIFCSPLOWO2_01_FULL_40_26]|nr:MAG: phosphatidylinositol kinase [Alphaproteobacteria bacterium RIFCSPHIGHO2_02_FULL_40_34]OFW95290.1 MAG: phosphatidylinositol kinase [Alphaproteobacteria bacterium RIFCSPLOWO2_01_FULL_40_26]OFX09193.1 MAG: phosphatidylinositol kinase [Alphaproteobacteria bacterium RIFCSPLOWO2_02_FULL_40_19]OFX11549.1 MAG: phosphatidylinositol kinase [Alphaproteobacteria bacterium RIFCSPLOWO2_12_FULL_40_11]
MNDYTSVSEVKVGLNFGDSTIPVGRLAIRDHKIYFEYHSTFIETSLNISPLRLPLKSGVSSFDYNLFEGLPGVFNDSLPDGWGRLLFDRFVRSLGILPSDITPLDRLAHVGLNGLGALVYEPDHSIQENSDSINLDQLAEQTQEVLDGTSDEVLQDLLALNGSSAGARPKALIGLNNDRKNIIHGIHDLPDGYAPWIVKFSNTQDSADAGAIEYVYALIAKKSGISMPDVHLFLAQKGAGYFAVKRFDRNGKQRFHMHTACGLLHSDFRTSSLDYEDLIALTGALTRDAREIERLYQLAVFNVLAHNRDDHSKNFSFLMDAKGEWKLSPAYDLTFSSGPRGEQSTMVMGEGRNPSIDHLIKLGHEAKLSKARITEIIDQTQTALASLEVLASEYGVSANNIRLISKHLHRT